MDEKKIKNAFKKVKKDTDYLLKEITSLKIELAREEMGKKDVSGSKKIDNFIKNVEDEFKKLNLSLKELEDKIKHNENTLKATSKNIEKLNNLHDKNYQDIEQNYLSVSSIEERFAEFTELINEKVDLEIGSLKLELTEEIARIYDKFYLKELEFEKAAKKTKAKSATSSKTKKIISKEGPENIKTISSEEPKKEGKVKKVLKWLFVDEEEDDSEINDVKKEVKNKKN